MKLFCIDEGAAIYDGDLIASYAAMDGDMDKTNDAIDLMGEFCDSLRK